MPIDPARGTAIGPAIGLANGPATPETQARPNHLFVVRLWREPQADLPGPWRGSVEHIPTGQRLYFASLMDLADFIDLRLGIGLTDT